MTARKCKVCGRAADGVAGWCRECCEKLVKLPADVMKAAEWGAKRRAAAQKAGGK